jgi:hypothetical protein
MENMTLLDMIAYVKAAGGLAAPLFAALYWLERDERRDAQKELRDVSMSSVQAMGELKAMVSTLSDIFDPSRRK